MRILVTGAAGFIASHFCKKYKDKADIYGVDNMFRGNKSFFQGKRLYKADIRNTNLIKKIIKENDIELVVHFAALAYVGEGEHQPFSYYNNNVQGTLSLLEAMKVTGIKKLIFSSSCATYGNPKSLPISESCVQVPVNVYGESKMFCEKCIKSASQEFGLRALNLRYFNVIGSDPKLEIGELHNPETHLLPNIINAALYKDSFLSIYGNDYPTQDGTCERDFVNVNDLAEAHWKAIKYLERSIESFDNFNIGYGSPISIKKMILLVEKVLGLKVKSRTEERRIGDVPSLWADITKANKKLIWTPKTKVEVSIEQTFGWLKKLGEAQSK